MVARTINFVADSPRSSRSTRSSQLAEILKAGFSHCWAKLELRSSTSLNVSCHLSRDSRSLFPIPAIGRLLRTLQVADWVILMKLFVSLHIRSHPSRPWLTVGEESLREIVA